MGCGICNVEIDRCNMGGGRCNTESGWYSLMNAGVPRETTIAV